MTAGRGCTPLLPHEAAGLRRMLDLRNAGQRVHSNRVAFDPVNLNLTPSENHNPYQGATDWFDRIDSHLLYLMNNTTRKWELFLQAYLMQEIKRNAALTSQLFPSVEVVWIGNEIYAGAGMQSIDILVQTQSQENTFIHLIELKSEPAEAEAAAQLNRYIKWLRAHIPDISVHQIVPTIIAPEIKDVFHREIRIYLRGHGISQYRVINVDRTLHFSQHIETGF
jgi:hypothetical protein